jgi:hypothetical protein
MTESISTASNPGQRLDQLVKFADELQSRIDDLNAQLDHQKSVQIKVLQTDLPNLLHELGLNEVTRGDLKVSLQSGVSISIPEERRGDAYTWLAENGAAEIVKTEVKSLFSAGEYELAEKAKKALEDEGFETEIKMSVHPSTLKSWAKESISKGVVPPAELFATHVYDAAKITRIKKSK